MLETVEDNEGYLPVSSHTGRQTRVPARQRFKSPIYWLTVVLVFAAVIFVQQAWGSGWALVPIVLAPFALGLADRVIIRQRS